eukprot:5977596-Pleurochrysis_carterae.AAC.1
MRKADMFGMYTPFRAGGQGEWDSPCAALIASPLILAKARAWLQRLTKSAGASLLRAVPNAPPTGPAGTTAGVYYL